MKTLRIALILSAVMVPAQDSIPEDEWRGWQPWMFGAPCTLKSDFEDGACIKVEVDKIDWSRKK